jgi:hypothetical protein
VSWVTSDGNVQSHNSHRAYLHFLEHSATIHPLAAVDFQRLTLTQDAGSFAVKARSCRRTTSKHSARICQGRASTRTTRLDSTGVIVIGYHVWQNTFHGSEDVVGRTVILNGRP